MAKAPNGLRPLLRDFLLEEPTVRLMQEPIIAFGQCGWVSTSLVQFARKYFFRAHLVLLEDPDADLSSRRLPTYQRFGVSTSHVVVCIDGWYVDYTARQFDAKAPFPLVTPERSIVVEHWGKVTEPATIAQLEEATA